MHSIQNALHARSIWAAAGIITIRTEMGPFNNISASRDSFSERNSAPGFSFSGHLPGAHDNPFLLVVEDERYVT